MPRPFTVDVLSVEELAPAITSHFGEERFLSSGSPPAAPGVYVWDSDGKVLYVGSGKSLRERLQNEQTWVDCHDPDTMWQVSVVHMLKLHQANVVWIETADEEDALKLERRLIEWHRACVGIAPVIVGWDAKPGSKRAAAEQWARNLWGQL